MAGMTKVSRRKIGGVTFTVHSFEDRGEALAKMRKLKKQGKGCKVSMHKKTGRVGPYWIKWNVLQVC